MEEYTVLQQLKIRLRQFHMEKVNNEDGTQKEVLVFDHEEENPILEQILNQAEKDIRNRRNYPNSYSEEQISEDLKSFYSVQINLALYDYEKENMEFETSHAEPGITRSYIKRNEILSEVVPFVHIISR